MTRRLPFERKILNDSKRQDSSSLLFRRVEFKESSGRTVRRFQDISQKHAAGIKGTCKQKTEAPLRYDGRLMRKHVTNQKVNGNLMSESRYLPRFLPAVPILSILISPK